MGSRMRVGLIGAGRIGAVHARTLAGLDAVDTIAIADAEPARAAALVAGTAEAAPDPTAVSAIGPAEVLESVDAVVIAAATGGHAALIAAAARAGLPVFCEKPLAGDLPGTLEVLAAVRAAGVPLQVGFQRRFDPGYRALRAAVRGGELGRLHLLRACTSDPAPPPAGYLATSGGLFRDCSVHDFDIIRWLTGHEVISVYASGNDAGEAMFTDAGDIGTGVAVLRLDDGTLATVTATRCNGAGYDVRLEAVGSAGTRVAGLDERTPLISAEPAAHRPADPYTGFADRFLPAYRAELAAFVAAVSVAGPSPCGGDDALAALRVAEAAELSRARDAPVEVTR